MPKDLTAELISALYGRSSVFMGSMEIPTERIVYHLLYKNIHDGRTIIWVCIRDTPETIFSKFSAYDLSLNGYEERLWFVDSTITGLSKITYHTSRCLSLDYACMIIEVGKLLQEHPGSLVMFDNIGILAALDRVDAIVRPLKFLDARIRAQGGGFVTMLSDKAVPGSAEAELLGIIDVIIRVEEEKIQALVGSKELTIPFCFSGSELILGSFDINNDLRELFSLTVEEKKKLELEVEAKAHLYGERFD